MSGKNLYRSQTEAPRIKSQVGAALPIYPFTSHLETGLDQYESNDIYATGPFNLLLLIEIKMD